MICEPEDLSESSQTREECLLKADLEEAKSDKEALEDAKAELKRIKADLESGLTKKTKGSVSVPEVICPRSFGKHVMYSKMFDFIFVLMYMRILRPRTCNFLMFVDEMLMPETGCVLKFHRRS